MLMPLRRHLAVLVIAALSSPVPVHAAEAYVFRFRTDTLYFNPDSCLLVGWRDELLFHNTTTTPQVVRSLSSTAGAANPPGSLVIPAGGTASTLVSENIRQLGGDPYGFQLLVNRLEIPEGVIIGSRAVVSGPPPGCGRFPTTSLYDYGSLALPVFRSLVPANQPQIHLSIDLGVQRRHTNVIIYNPGTSVATARVELVAGCDGVPLLTRNVTVGPNSVTEVTGLTDDPLGQGCLRFGTTTDFARYVRVVVDQPSLSHALTVSDEFITPTIAAASGSQ